jgi:outer membrane protein OmpA-like peptidoglycan-associated protein
MPDGMSVSFDPERADLNPASAEALRTFARSVPKNPNVSVNVWGYAAGSADDPSTPRRLSLARALAARSVLLAEGIASERIYVRAMGATAPGPNAPPADDRPADRVDVATAGANGTGKPGPPPTAAAAKAGTTK